MRFFIVAAALSAFQTSTAEAKGFDIGHRDCIHLLDEIYDLPAALDQVYDAHSSLLTKEQNPSPELEKISKHLKEMRSSHIAEWKDVSEELRAYCEGLKF
ncbi:hypothetical protein [Tritonibacter scottomollicae]|uniref:hypothetical protein n=1 Tax=Tritonibacter scottomollicae TaxID=483013 RepID=UPI003AA7C00F